MNIDPPIEVCQANSNHPPKRGDCDTNIAERFNWCRNSKERQPIGIFDSGVGGLTVLKEIRRLLPDESLIYFGDNARAPYGGKSPETLQNYGREIINFLLNKNAKAVVMACGSSSSVSYNYLRSEFPNLPIIDTIRPAVKATMELYRKNPDLKPVFTATEATIKSGLFVQLLNEATDNESLPKLQIYTRACPLFAPMAEAGLKKNDGLLLFAAENYLSDLRGKVTALILGCTHYPLLTDALTTVLGEITFINPAIATAEAAINLPPPTAPATVEYYTSGSPKDFEKIAGFILNEKIIAKHVCETTMSL